MRSAAHLDGPEALERLQLCCAGPRRAARSRGGSALQTQPMVSVLQTGSKIAEVKMSGNPTADTRRHQAAVSVCTGCCKCPVARARGLEQRRSLGASSRALGDFIGSRKGRGFVEGNGEFMVQRPTSQISLAFKHSGGPGPVSIRSLVTRGEWGFDF